MEKQRIALAEVVQNLRDELVTAVEAGKGRSLRFDLDEVKLEAQVVVSRESEGKAGVKFWVLDAGLADKEHLSRLQKVTLTLKPRDASGKAVKLTRKK